MQMSLNVEMIFFICKCWGYRIVSLHVRWHTFRLSKSNWVLGIRKGLDLLKVVYCLYSRGVENLNWEQTLRQKLPALVVSAKHGRFFQSCLCSHYWVVHIFILSSTSPKLDPASLTKIGTKLSSPNSREHLLSFFEDPLLAIKCRGRFILSTISQMKLSQLEYSFQTYRHLMLYALHMQMYSMFECLNSPQKEKLFQHKVCIMWQFRKTTGLCFMHRKPFSWNMSHKRPEYKR